MEDGSMANQIGVNHYVAEEKIEVVLSSTSAAPAESSTADFDHVVSKLHGFKHKLDWERAEEQQVQMCWVWLEGQVTASTKGNANWEEILHKRALQFISKDKSSCGYSIPLHDTITVTG